MRIDLGAIPAVTMPGMNGGTGDMTVRMVNDDRYRIVHTVIYPGGSLGTHARSAGDDMNCIRSGTVYPPRISPTQTSASATVRQAHSPSRTER